jgi:hypothetical protein
MNRRAAESPAPRRHRREKATIDHLVDQVFDPDTPDKQPRPSTTESGTSVEEQVRKEWDPKKDGGVPIF